MANECDPDEQKEHATAWARRSAATLARRLRRQGRVARLAEDAQRGVALALEQLPSGAQQDAELATRLTLLAKALIQHRQLDAIAGRHSHKHGDALRTVLSIFGLEWAEVPELVAVKTGGDDARHGEFVPYQLNPAAACFYPEGSTQPGAALPLPAVPGRAWTEDPLTSPTEIAKAAVCWPGPFAKIVVSQSVAFVVVKDKDGDDAQIDEVAAERAAKEQAAAVPAEQDATRRAAAEEAAAGHTAAAVEAAAAKAAPETVAAEDAAAERTAAAKAQAAEKATPRRWWEARAAVARAWLLRPSMAAVEHATIDEVEVVEKAVPVPSAGECGTNFEGVDAPVPVDPGDAGDAELEVAVAKADRDIARRQACHSSVESGRCSEAEALECRRIEREVADRAHRDAAECKTQ